MSREWTEQEIKEAQEHQDVLLAIRAILATSSGKVFFEYLFKHLEVAELPPLGMEGNLLMDKLGFLRAGNSIFKLVAEAEPEKASRLLAQKEKDLYVEIYAEPTV